jgi:branched-chain amino acid transport system substrate-binding protein
MTTETPTPAPQNKSNSVTVQTAASLTPVQSKRPLALIIGLVVLAGTGLGLFSGWLLGSLTNKPVTEAVNKVSTVSADQKPFVIGMIVPLTGDGASYGTNAKEIALMLQKDLNATGGIGNRQVDFIFEDGQCTGENALMAAQKLINQDKVDLLYAGECSDEVLAAAPIAQQKKIISISTGATSPKISALGRYVFRSVPSDEVGGKVAAQYALSKLQGKKAAIIVENTGYALALKDVFKAEFEKGNGNIVIEKVFETGETEFEQFALDAKKVSPDVVYIIPQTPIPGVLAIKALRTAGVKAQVLTAEVLLARDEVEKHGKILEGMIGMEAYFDSSNEEYKKLNEKFINEYGREVAYPTDLVQIYDMINMYKDGYELVGSNDTDKIADYLYNNKAWTGSSGKITFNEQGDIISKPYGIFKVSNNTVTLLETYTPQQE